VGVNYDAEEKEAKMMKRLLGVLFALVLVFLLAVPHGTVHAASFTVTNINDSGSGSLRQAILDANATSGADTIDFNIPGVGPPYHPAPIRPAHHHRPGSH
jgi:hypothetical protein